MTIEIAKNTISLAYGTLLTPIDSRMTLTRRFNGSWMIPARPSPTMIHVMHLAVCTILLYWTSGTSWLELRLRRAWCVIRCFRIFLWYLGINVLFAPY
mmetsp:Transcript_4726/g.3884  ORF Transcript_4726/g.3884 Transcript_4726/m.3884 type:complete len:98 (-) Transcript_4726:138-431(-)